MIASELPHSQVEELRQQRWFGGKDRAVRSATVVDGAEWTAGDHAVRFELVAVQYDNGEPETYARFAADGALDALAEPAVAASLLTAMRAEATYPMRSGGSLSFSGTDALRQTSDDPVQAARGLGGEQSNSSIRYGDALVLKLFRRQQPGVQPELEMSRFLSQRGFTNMAPLAGAIEYTAADGAGSTLGVLHGFVANRGDAWQTFLRRVQDVLLLRVSPEAAAAPLARLGEVVADMHVALASVEVTDPAFTPQSIGPMDVALWKDAAADELRQALQGVSARGIVVEPRALWARLTGLETLVGASKTRHHGDLHLGQVLEAPDGDFTIIDFEGEPARPLEARRAKRTPLRDVAGMLRSFDYVRHTALGLSSYQEDTRLADSWHTAARRRFLEAYLSRVRRDAASVLPTRDADVHSALSALELEKAAYEVVYELNNRPDWVGIPLAALRVS